MKILLLGFSKIKYMPYLRFYLDNINQEQHDVHILYWNRDKVKENLDEFRNVTFHEFSRYQQDNVNIYSKIPNFIRYRFFAEKILHKENYDFVIILHTFPGVLLSDILTKKYYGKYIFDYRDYTYEKYDFFKKIIHKLVNNSLVTFVSSDGFRKFLPEDQEDKIYTSHNFIKDSLEHRDDRKRFGTVSDVVRISYWGFIRDENVNLMMIDRFTNDPRFEIHYYGREDALTERLKNYAAEKKAENVFFHGEYVPKDRYKFILNTDLIHNIFGDKNMMLAMSNRFYDSMIFRIPVLCMENSEMGKLAEKSGIGFSFDPQDSDCADKVYNYYLSVDRTEFDMACDAKLKDILKEYCRGCEIIKKITSEN